jgi:hypothetical protein
MGCDSALGKKLLSKGLGSGVKLLNWSIRLKKDTLVGISGKLID